MHRLAATIDGTRVPNCLEDLHIGGVVVIRIREVGIVPLPQHTQALESLTLGVDLLDGHLAAEPTNGRGGKLAELVLAHHVLNLVLDGKAMTIPTRNVGYLTTLHDPVPIDDVLADLVLRMAEVNRTVGIGRTVVQHELLVPLVLLERELVDARFLPSSKTLGFVLCQIRAHRKFRARQIGGLLVPICHLSGSFLRV